MNSSTGFITFLVTDIEGSTRLWEEQQTLMQAALARHDALLRSVIEANGGKVFKTTGDGCHAAFADPAAALRAALQAQRAFAADPDLGRAGDRLRVRMALHTGLAEHRDGDYFGPPLNRIARLLAAGHGGQVLLTSATQALVRGSLPEGTSLRDLGEHRLKDLIRPEHVFQLTVPDLPNGFPPLRSREARRHNLPVQSTALIGREKELREITERLRRQEVRLLTLTGAGGTGKTRLALQAAAELADAFEDGVVFVNLAPVADPALLPSAIAQALGVRESPERPLADTLPEYLCDKRLLLLLDNFEQITQAAPFVARLLTSAVGVKVLVTSRIPLHLQGEHEYPVPPLALPDLRRLPPLERLVQNEAVRFFLVRAQAVRPGFQLRDDNASAVAEICLRLDGLPLALELAAARIRVLTSQALLGRLEKRLELLTGGARDLPARQQTLRGTIEWSYDLLDEAERVLFRRLSVFAGGGSLEAIERVCGGEGAPGLELLDGVSSLVEKSLLRHEECATGEPRLVMLETIHEFALEKLEESGEADALGRRHAEYFLERVEEAGSNVRGSEQGRWISWMETEHDNLRVALRRTLARRDGELAGRLAWALWSFWFRHGHFREGRCWYAAVLSSEGISPRTRANALLGAGVLAWRQHDFTASQPLLEQSLSLWRELGDVPSIARTLNNLGLLAYHQGELACAEVLYAEAASRWREVGDKRGVGMVLNNLALLAVQRGDVARAESLYREGLSLARETENLASAAIALGNLGHLAYRLGDLRQARAHLRESVRFGYETRYVYSVTLGLALLAQVASAAEEWERAASLFGAAEAHFATIGTHVEPQDRDEYERALLATRSRLDAAAWEQAHDQGASMTLEEAIDYALAE